MLRHSDYKRFIKVTYIKLGLLTLAVFRDILVGEREGKVFIKDKNTLKWHHFGYIFPNH